MTAADARGERPVIFSAPMIKALLAGRKSQTRRALKPQPFYDERGLLWWRWSKFEGAACNDPVGAVSDMWFEHLPIAPGQRIWVKEAARRSPDAWVCAADDTPISWSSRGDLAGRKRDTCNSLFLLRSCSRLTLIVEAVKVERLAEISEADAVAEGVEPEPVEGRTYYRNYDAGARGGHLTARASYATLWNSIHGPDAWDINPWCCAIRFRTIPQNIDSLAPEGITP